MAILHRTWLRPGAERRRPLGFPENEEEEEDDNDHDITLPPNTNIPRLSLFDTYFFCFELPILVVGQNWLMARMKD
jgi:hypothetical protein